MNDKVFGNTFRLDQKLIDSLRALQTSDNILGAIDAGEIHYRDKFGNDFFSYLCCAFEKPQLDQIITAINSKYAIFDKTISRFQKHADNPTDRALILENLTKLYPFEKDVKTEPARKSKTFTLPNLRRTPPKLEESYLLETRSEVDELFEKLKEITTTSDLPQTLKEIFTKCDTIINRQTVQNQPISPTIVVSAMAIKMELALDFDIAFDATAQSDPKLCPDIILNCGNFSAVRNNANSFYVAHKEIMRINSLLPKDISSLLTPQIVSACISISRRVAARMIPSFASQQSDETAAVYEVPDLLAAASFAPQTSILEQANIRRMFHELWEVELLRPLLSNAAYATLGLAIKDGKLQRITPLKIIFFDKGLSSIRDTGDITGLTHDSRVSVAISTRDPHGIDTLRSDAIIKGTIIHELHHFWERLKHSQSSALPYLEGSSSKPPQLAPTIFQQFCNLLASGRIVKKVIPETKPDRNQEIKERLDRMTKEAEEIKKDSGLLVTQKFSSGGYRTLVREPFSTFNAVTHYEKDQETQHSEIVVRVPASLGTLTAEGHSAEEAMKAMKDSGLEECIKFFLEEVSQMQEKIQKLQEQSQIIFTNPQKEKDFFAKNDLERALDLQDTQAVVTLCRPEQITTLSHDLPLLHRAILHLIKTAKNSDHPDSEIALSKFREIRDQLYFSPDTPRAAFSLILDTIDITIDEEHIKQIASRSSKEIAADIRSGAIPFRDKFGNDFISYAIRASQKLDRSSFYHKVEDFMLRQYSRISGQHVDTTSRFIEGIISKITPEQTFYRHQESDDFLPGQDQNLLYKSLVENNPKMFWKILKSADDPMEILQQKVPSKFKENNSVIERIAARIEPQIEKSKRADPWLNAFKKILRQYPIDLTKKYGDNDKPLIEMLHWSLREDVKSEVAEIRKKPSSSTFLETAGSLIGRKTKTYPTTL